MNTSNLDRLLAQAAQRFTSNTVESVLAHDDVCELLGSHAGEIVEVLKNRCEAIEMEAADLSYKVGLGAGEWDAFIDRVPAYQEWKNLTTLLARLEQEATCQK